MTSSLMFSMVETRPDITFATSIASQYAKNSSHKYIKTVKTILKSIKSSKHYDITYDEQEKLIVKRYSNLNLAWDLKSRKSTFDFIFMLNSGSVSWCSKEQPTVALSFTEAEYIALTLVAKDTRWIRLLLTKLSFLQPDQ